MFIFAVFYGSNLWDLYGDAANKVYTYWNILIRSTYNLPYATHRHFLSEFSCRPHIRIALLRRFVKFYNTLKNCQKIEVKHLFHIQKLDFRSIFGRNCLNLCNELNVTMVENIDISLISMPELYILPEDMFWQVGFLKNLLECQKVQSDNFLSEEHITDLIAFLACG